MDSAWSAGGRAPPVGCATLPQVNWTSRWTGSWRIAGAVIALVITGSWLPLFLGRVSPSWDAFDFYGPYTMLVGDFARHGRFLLWNPFINGGSPDYLEPQTGAFSPLVVLIGAVAGGSRHGFELYWLLVWLLGPLGVLTLGRHLGAPAWGGLVAALGVALCPVCVFAEHYVWVGLGQGPRHGPSVDRGTC